MSKKSNYNKQMEKYDEDNARLSYEVIEKKIGNEAITADEMAVYLRKLDEAKRGYCTGKTVRNSVMFLCKDSKGLINLEDFKPKTISNLKIQPYVFPPEIHKLLLTLFDSKYFDGRSNNNKVANRKELNNKLMENAKKYLDEDDFEIIKASPVYQYILMENDLTAMLLREFSLLMAALSGCDLGVRCRLMGEVLEMLRETKKKVHLKNAESIFSQAVYRQDKDTSPTNDETWSMLFYSDSLQDCIIALIGGKMKGARTGERSITKIPDDDLAAMKQTYEASEPADLSIGQDDKLAKAISKLEIQNIYDALDKFNSLE